MTRFGYFLSSEEHGPHDLILQARLARAAGFEGLWISDHFHPWVDSQGESSFVWSMIGALSQVTTLPITTAVTCPIHRIHPAIIAQAAATSSVLLEGRFRLGLGSGEALNEHVVGGEWPPAGVRLAKLEEAVEIIRRLFTGEVVTHRGEYFTVETARLYTRPKEPPPIYLAAFGKKAATMAGRLADGLISLKPDASVKETFDAAGGAGRPLIGGLKVCWAPDESEARKTVVRLWPTEMIQGEALQLLPQPRHFEQLAGLVSEDMVSLPVGPDPELHLAALKPYVNAGYDEVYIAQIGPDQERFFEFYEHEVLPLLR